MLRTAKLRSVTPDPDLAILDEDDESDLLICEMIAILSPYLSRGEAQRYVYERLDDLWPECASIH